MKKFVNPPPSSNDPHQWQPVLSALIEMVQSQQSQIQTLTNDRKHLEDYILLQRTNRSSRVSLLKSHISQMKKEEEMVRQVHATRLNLIVSAKEREALLYKNQLEIAQSDLEDFRACVEALGTEISQLQEKLKCSGIDNSKNVKDPDEKEQHIVALEKEIRKMKQEHKKLVLKKDSDISALVAEKDFMWNQFKRRDDDYTQLFKTKQMEDDRSSETIQMLQLSADEKDEAIAKLAAERATLESNVGRLTQEAEGTKERIEELQLQLDKLQLLDKEKDETVANLRNELARSEMSLTRCTRGRLKSSEGSDSQRGSRNDSAALGDSHPRKRYGKLSHQNMEGSSNQKRRLVHESSSGSRVNGSGIVLQAKSSAPLETPRLFSSKLKVPKLKNLPPPELT